MANEISKFDDIIDSRDVIARIEELEGMRDDESAPIVPETDSPLDEEELAELDALKALAEEAEAAGDWRYGGTLIRDSYFKEYAQQLAEDIGAISGNEQWPLTCIDWDKAARELKYDYMTVYFNGVTYWIRS